jgi:protoheme IX farnesyltransferase
MTSWAYIKAFSALSRTILSLFMALCATAVCIFFRHGISSATLFVFVGVAMLSASASALNQYQERESDRLMQRTQNRPLPSGSLSAVCALVWSGAVGLAGLLTLFLGTTPLAAFFGLLTFLWYSAVYTPLKRKTGFAAIIGAPTGAFAPLIGCAAVGANIDVKVIGIALFMFLWQVPHFLLLLLKYGGEYEKAGFPTPALTIDQPRLKRIIFIWLLAASASTLLFPFIGVISGVWMLALLVWGAVAFIAFFYYTVVRPTHHVPVTSAIRHMYFYQAFILAMLIMQGIQG